MKILVVNEFGVSVRAEFDNHKDAKQYIKDNGLEITATTTTTLKRDFWYVVR